MSRQARELSRVPPIPRATRTIFLAVVRLQRADAGRPLRRGAASRSGFHSRAELPLSDPTDAIPTPGITRLGGALERASIVAYGAHLRPGVRYDEGSIGQLSPRQM